MVRARVMIFGHHGLLRDGDNVIRPRDNRWEENEEDASSHTSENIAKRPDNRINGL